MPVVAGECQCLAILTAGVFYRVAQQWNWEAKDPGGLLIRFLFITPNREGRGATKSNTPGARKDFYVAPLSPRALSPHTDGVLLVCLIISCAAPESARPAAG